MGHLCTWRQSEGSLAPSTYPHESQSSWSWESGGETEK